VSPGCFLHSWDLTLQGFQPELEPTETKLAHDTPTATRLRTPVFNGGGASVSPEGVELKLGLVADLGREGLVASYVEVGSAGNFVCSYALAGFDIAKDPDFCHESLRSV